MLNTLLALIGGIAAVVFAFMAKSKQADRAAQKLDHEREVLSDTVKVVKEVDEHRRDPVERDRVRDKYTRPPE